MSIKWLNIQYKMRVQFSFFVAFFLTLISTCTSASDYFAEFDRVGITPSELAVLVNVDDSQSVEVAQIYAKKRGIPSENLIHLHFDPAQNEMSQSDFIKLKQEIEAKTKSHIQGYAISWTKPYRVVCMSITSAISFGFDQAYCGGCNPTRESPYFNTTSTTPFNDFKIRPSMMLAGDSVQEVIQLIDRGIRADSSFPSGNSYLIKGNGGNYDVRAANYNLTREDFNSVFFTYVTKQVGNGPLKRKNILFYFIGAPQVTRLEQLEFLPGAIADHLTSFGGDLYGKHGQSVSLAWLKAGATASYGTVVEPCNHLQKFPNPASAMYYYLKGNSLLEAYWKSVAWPGQGLFIGEPLSSPFKPVFSKLNDKQYSVKIFAENQTRLLVHYTESLTTAYTKIAEFQIKRGINQINIPPELTSGNGGYFKFEII